MLVHLRPDISGVDYMECNYVETFKTDNFVIMDENGNKATIFLRSASYCSCIAQSVDVSRHKRRS